MANRFAVASGNFNDTATWSTTAAGSPGASVPIAGDNAIANNRTVTITANATCDSVRNDNLSGATAGGGFVLNNGVTLTANVISAAGGIVTCVSYSGNTSAWIVGTVTGSSTSGSPTGVVHSGTGTLTITSAGTHTAGRAFANNSTGTLTISGNCTATGSTGSTPLVTNATGVINITGNCVGGSGGGSHCVSNTSNGPVNITGIVTGGSVSGALGVNNTSTGQVTIIGDVTASAGIAVSSTSATVRISGSFIYAADGTVPVSAPRIILNTTPLAAKTRYALDGAGAYVDMFTADNSLGQAIPADVRLGTVYASGSLTGTLAVPSVGSVAAGVPVDATVGTATLTASDVRAAMGLASANLDTQLAAIPTASQNATQVRTELTQELTEITETHLIHGLKTGSPLNVTPTARTAGAISQTITGDGVTTTTVTR